MIKNIKIEFNENEIKAEEFAALLKDNIILDYCIDSNSLEKNCITIWESYELGDLDAGLLEEALEKIAAQYPESIIKVSGEGDDKGYVWRFEAECSMGKVDVKKSDYFEKVYIGDYEISEYQNFVNYGNGKGLTKEDFENYKKDGTNVLYRSASKSKPNMFFSAIPIEINDINDIEDNEGMNWEFTELCDGVIRLDKYTGNAKTITVSSNIEGKTVVEIGKEVFEDSSIQKISLPDSITSIGERAFCNCKNLVTINMPSNLKVICEEAFAGIHKIPIWVFPEGLEIIERGAFYCSSVTEAHIPESVTTIGENAFSNDAFVFDDSEIIVFGKTGSTAERFSSENHLSFKEE